VINIQFHHHLHHFTVLPDRW